MVRLTKENDGGHQVLTTSASCSKPAFTGGLGMMPCNILLALATAIKAPLTLIYDMLLYATKPMAQSEISAHQASSPPYLTTVCFKVREHAFQTPNYTIAGYTLYS